MGGIDQTRLPERLRVRAAVIVCIKGKDAIPFGGYKNDVVRSFSWNCQMGYVKRLGVNLSIHGI